MLAMAVNPDSLRFGISVNRQDALADFAKADKDGNQKLSKQELAEAAIRNYNLGNRQLGNLYNVFLFGGKDGKGLSPDFYTDLDGQALGQDGFVTQYELGRLAIGTVLAPGTAERLVYDPSFDVIDDRDFSALFPTNYTAVLPTVDLTRLQQVADGTTPTPSPLPNFNAKALTVNANGSIKIGDINIPAGAAITQSFVGILTRVQELIVRIAPDNTTAQNAQDNVNFLKNLKDGFDRVDTNANGQLSGAELQALAAKTGSATAIEKSDFDGSAPTPTPGNDQLQLIRQILQLLIALLTRGGLGGIGGGTTYGLYR
jgi:hypothetical protein